ncbi:MAG: glycosyltransferase family 4 protein, partial [Pseudomonadota bacterium]|nr:glycosyltransferase family 4 protein [Pseudomonadota bacterium]
MPKKLCFVVNNAAFFASHRLPIAIKFIQLGGQVDLIIGKPGSKVMEGHAVNEIESHGIRIWRVPLSTSGVNPILELIGLYHVQRHLRAIQPDVVHCASPKGIIHGGLGARIAGVRSVVFSVSGLGFAFTSTDNSLTRRIARKAFEAVAKIAFVHGNKRVIVQNTQDYNELIDLGVAQPSNLVVTKGSGTDVAKISEVDIESKEKLVVLPSRLIRDKGVCEYLEASNQLASRHPDWTFAVIGANDYDNPSRLSDSELERYTQKENVIWLPHSEDISSLLRRTSIVCLPSYREGMPKALLDAAAAGCAIVTTDVPGCLEAIIPDETGDIVPVKSINELREALSNLIKEESRRHRYAARALEFARDELDRDTVVRINLDQYDDLLSDDV